MNTESKEGFWKKILVIIGLGIVLILAVYFGKKYKASQKKAEITEFYNQFSDESYINFAKELEASIINYSPDFFDGKVNTKSFLSFSDKELTESFYKRKVSEILSPLMKFGSIIVEQIRPIGDFRFTRFYKEDGIPHFVYRIYDGDMIYFIDFTVGIKDNEPVLNDSYYYFSGITMSKNISNIYYKTIDLDRQYLSNIETYNKIRYYNKNGDHERAFEVLTAIPAKYHDALYFQYLLIAATYNGDEKLQTVINQLINATPDDEKLHTYLYFIESVYFGKTETIETRVDSLKQYVGEDSIFDYYIGVTHINNENLEEAIPYFDKTINEMPNFFDAYFDKLYSLLQLKETEKALEVLTIMYEKFSFAEEDMSFDLTEFNTFINSPSYKAIFKDDE